MKFHIYISYIYIPYIQNLGDVLTSKTFIYIYISETRHGVRVCEEVEKERVYGETSEKHGKKE